MSTLIVTIIEECALNYSQSLRQRLHWLAKVRYDPFSLVVPILASSSIRRMARARSCGLSHLAKNQGVLAARPSEDSNGG